MDTLFWTTSVPTLVLAGLMARAGWEIGSIVLRGVAAAGLSIQTVFSVAGDAGTKQLRCRPLLRQR